MDKGSAINLLNDTFTQKYEQSRFERFSKELFNEIVISPQTWPVWKEYLDYIESYQMLASYKDSKNKVIDVLIVKLKRSSSRDRARTMQRNFIAKYLGNANKDAAIVAFHGEDPEDWRFSFVKMEYHLSKGRKGKLKVQTDLTPAKRYSFLVGLHEPNHTCRKQFLNLLIEEKLNPSLDEIEAAFSIDNITKEFFGEYKELYLKLKESLEKTIKKDEYVRREFEEKGISTIDFSKKLLGQIVFLYFLQKKGWLGVERDPDTGRFKKWGAGPRNFLRSLFEKKSSYKNFFNDVLEPLFYEALATERDEDYYSRFNCRIPFLNGGLFEPINDYDWAGTSILLDNALFENVLNTFDRFNFTIKEDEPLEKEVAIDPEMLGKVFENLLEITDRKSKGSFYTPREIVYYMCQQSLINYLETNTKLPKEDIEAFIQLRDFGSGEDLRNLREFKKLEQDMIRGKSDVKFIEKRMEDVISKMTLPGSIIQSKERIDELLANIKVVDPAVGSGAFPVGMMNEIVKARSILTLFFDEKQQEKRTIYSLKRQAIENSLYGVDIDSSAVDIAKLRFWLSLIVDEEDTKNLKPLPNLDHKIMCGNSLLEEFEGVKLFDESLLGEPLKKQSAEAEQIDKRLAELYQQVHDIHTGKIKDDSKLDSLNKEISKLKRQKKNLGSSHDEEREQQTLEEATTKRVRESQKKLTELRKLQKQYFNEQNRKTKKELQEKIDKIEWELIEETLKEQGNEEAIQKLNQYKKNKSKPFFLWKLYFSEIFQRENPGFDVVIANPPYVEHKKLKHISNSLRNKYSTYSGTADLYVYFYDLAIQVLRGGGVLTFISSNKFMRTRYGEKLRELLSSKKMLEVIDFTEVHVFEALVASCVMVTLNNANDNTPVRITMTQDDLSDHSTLSNYINEKGYEYDSQRLGGDIWNFQNESYQAIKDNIDKKSKRIHEIGGIRIFRGVTTGFNPAFVIDEKTKKELESDKRSLDIIQPLLQGRDIRKWRYEKSTHYLLQTGFDIDIKNKYPQVFVYLDNFKPDLKSRTDQGKRWWNLRACAYYPEFEKEKIVWGLTADKWAFAYDNKGNYLPSNGYILTSEKIPVKYILGFLNSRLLKFYFSFIGIMTAGGAFTLKHETIRELPLVPPQGHESTEIIKIVDEILKISTQSDYSGNLEKQKKVTQLEKEIDNLIYKMYKFTPEEIKIIEEPNTR